MEIYNKMLLTLKSLHEIHTAENKRLFKQIEVHELSVNTRSIAIKKLKNFVISEDEKSNLIKNSIDSLEQLLLEEKGDAFSGNYGMILIKQTSAKLQDAMTRYNEELRIYKRLLQNYISSQN